MYKRQDVEFEEGDFVLAYYPPLESSKVFFTWRGPFQIHKKVTALTYQLKNPETGEVYPELANINRLAKYHPEHAALVEGGGPAQPEEATQSQPDEAACPDMQEAHKDKQKDEPEKQKRKRVANGEESDKRPRTSEEDSEETEQTQGKNTHREDNEEQTSEEKRELPTESEGVESTTEEPADADAAADADAVDTAPLRFAVQETGAGGPKTPYEAPKGAQQSKGERA